MFPGCVLFSLIEDSYMYSNQHRKWTYRFYVYMAKYHIEYTAEYKYQHSVLRITLSSYTFAVICYRHCIVVNTGL